MSRIRIAALAASVSLTAALALPQAAGAQTTPGNPSPVSVAQPADAILLTIFLKHDQSKTVLEINDQLKRQNYVKRFPPKGIEIVSWYVMMGIGQVVTLRVPPARLREVNLAIEQTAWGAFRTEFYPTYDYKPVALEARKDQ